MYFLSNDFFLEKRFLAFVGLTPVKDGSVRKNVVFKLRFCSIQPMFVGSMLIPNCKTNYGALVGLTFVTATRVEKYVKTNGCGTNFEFGTSRR